MKTLHDAAIRQSILDRIDRLTPTSQRQWGKMRVDQMLRHLNAAMEMTLGRLEAKPRAIGIPRPLLKLFVFHMPWPKGKAPTAPELIAADSYEFESERGRLKQLIGEVAARETHGIWQHHPAFGPLTGTESSRLQYRHCDHHLRQFGV